VLQRNIVEEAYKNLRDKEFEEFAEKLTTTHNNLSEIYDISSGTMDKLVKLAEDSKLSMGSKMVSCSYHDSTLNFLRKKNYEKFKNYITKKYVHNNGAELEIENYYPVEGAKQLKLKTSKTM
jgi:galactokinase